jgi:hypothetical protein
MIDFGNGRTWREKGETAATETRMGAAATNHEGACVAFDPGTQQVTFLTWNHTPYEGWDVECGHTLGDLLSGLGITLEDCKAALEGGDAR